MDKYTSYRQQESMMASRQAEHGARSGTSGSLGYEIVRGRSLSIDHLPAGRSGRAYPRSRIRISLGGLLLFVLLALMTAVMVILVFFNFRHATIYGNTKYSQEQIESFITRGRLGDNTFVMALKYHQRTVRNIPFIDRIDIDIVNPSTVRVNIKEKPLDGVIEGDGTNIYLSSDGTVQTVSGRSFDEVTKITGIIPADAAAGETVSGADADSQVRLDLVLDFLRAAQKYELHADAVDSDTNGNLTATFGRVRIRLGKTGFDQKMHRIHQITPCLEGRRGVITMTGSRYEGTELVLSPH